MLGLIFVTVVLIAVLVSGAKWFMPKRSLLGMFMGLIAGYIVAAMLVRAIAPEYAALVPLPFGFGPPAPDAARSSLRPASRAHRCRQRILMFLNSLVDRGLITACLGVVIALFLLLAARSLNRGAKKG